MTDFVDILKEFADKYRACGHDPSALSDEDLNKYIDAMDELISTFSIVFNKLKDEQYQRRIDAAHMDEK